MTTNLEAGEGLETGKLTWPAVKINLKSLEFYTIFILIYFLSGILTMLTLYRYRMGLVSALILPLVFLYGIKVNKVVLTYVALTVVIILSALINQSSLLDFVQFMRTLGFSFLMYYLVELYLRPQNITRVLKICTFIGLIQLPVMLLQWRAYNFLPESLKALVGISDFGFGTFNFKTDYSMTFFLVALIIFYLFENRRSYFIRYRWPLLIYFSVTVLIANAQIVKLILLIVWAVYLLTHLRIRTLLMILGSSVFFIAAILALYRLGLMTEKITTFVDRLGSIVHIDTSIDVNEVIARGAQPSRASMLYSMLFKEDFSPLGIGPGRFSNIFTNRYQGDSGHFFTFYREIGPLGWILSVLVLFFIAFPIRQWKIRVSLAMVLLFVSINVLSFTSTVMNDIGVMLTYCIFTKTYLVSPPNPG